MSTEAQTLNDTVDPGRRRVLVLCGGLVVLLAALVVPQLHATTSSTQNVRWAIVGLVALFYVVCEVCEVEIELRRESHSFAFTSVPLVVGLLFLPIPLLIKARVAASGLVLGALRRQDRLKLSLNLLSHALEVAAAGLIVALVGVPEALGPRAWVAAGLAVIAADLLGAAVVTAAISLFQGEWEASLLKGIWVPFVVAIVDVSVALIIAGGLHNGSLEAWLALPIIGFVVGITRSYAKVVSRYNAMARLDDFARDLGSAVAAGNVENSLLPRIADVLRADTAWVWSPDVPDEAPSAKRVYRVFEDTVELEAPSRFDHAFLASPGDGVRLFGPGNESAELAQSGFSEALVGCLTVGEAQRVVIGVGDRSGATRGFDQEDAVLFSTLCSHAAVSLSNVGLVDRLRTESADNEFLATHDPLTGLPNRTLFHRRLADRLHDRGELAVLLVDLDRFKEVNDTLGHACGDELLIEVGRRLGPWLCEDDVLARLGGDEFALLVSAEDGDSARRRALEVLFQLR